MIYELIKIINEEKNTLLIREENFHMYEKKGYKKVEEKKIEKDQPIVEEKKEVQPVVEEKKEEPKTKKKVKVKKKNEDEELEKLLKD